MLIAPPVTEPTTVLTATLFNLSEIGDEPPLAASTTSLSVARPPATVAPAAAPAANLLAVLANTAFPAAPPAV